MSSLFSTAGHGTAQTAAGKMLAAITTMVTNMDRNAMSEVGHKAFARESGQADSSPELQASYGSVHDTMTAALKRVLGGESGVKLDAHLLSCAVESAVMAASYEKAIARRANVTPTVNGIPFIGTHGLHDGFGERMQLARESFDNRDNSTVMANSVAYNLMSGTQNPPAELFFPRVTVPVDNVGVAVTIRLTQVMQDKKRALNGNVTDFGRRNLAFGMIDPSILRNDSTRTIPVYRTESAAAGKFATGTPAYDKVFEGETYRTAPLAFGVELDIAALSQTAAMLTAGQADRTDALDSDVKLENVYLEVAGASTTKHVFAISVSALAGNNFIWVGQDLARTQKLSMETKQLWIQPTAKDVSGAAITGPLAVLAGKNLAVRLSAFFSGSVNLEDGRMIVNPNNLRVESVVDLSTGTVLPAANTDVIAIKAAFAAARWDGFDQESRRANANKAERGDLLDTQYYTQIWAVPYRSPITSLRPVQDQFHSESADLELLSQATYIRTSGAAIDTIFSTIDLLRSIKGSEYDPKAAPELLGVARMLIKPILLEGNVRLNNIAQVTNTADLPAAITGALVNSMRDQVYRAFRDSMLQAVVESGAAGTNDMPTVICICDPMLSRYLMVEGEMRTIGPDFKLVVKTSPALKVQNKIIMSFGFPEQSSSNAVNSFHFGNMLWSAELAMMLPISREGRTTRELTVQPRFRHIVNMAILMVLNVTGIEQLVGTRVPMDVDILKATGFEPNAQNP